MDTSSNSVSWAMPNDMTHHVGKTSEDVSVDSFGHKEEHPKLYRKSLCNGISCQKGAKKGIVYININIPVFV